MAPLATVATIVMSINIAARPAAVPLLFLL
jgi:hypothetical protein